MVNEMRLPLKGKKIVMIGATRYIHIPSSYFDNGILKDEDLIDAEIIVPEKNAEAAI